MVMKNFADKLVAAIRAKGTPICVGLDPRIEEIPQFLVRAVASEGDYSATMLAAQVIIAFNKAIIDAVHDLVPVVKPQIAFYEVFGEDGIYAYRETLRYARSKGLLTIADAKRNDIGSTAEAYAQAFLGEVSMFDGEEFEVVTPIFEADSLTVTPYLGWDGVKPFLEEAEKYERGVFALVKTSNRSSGDLQDLVMADGRAVYEIMGHYVDSWGADYIGESGYSALGAVVGATYPEEAKKLRAIMPQAFFLVPGYGAQGATAADVAPCFNSDGLGALINNSRGIIYAYKKLEGFGEAAFAQAARAAVLEMREELK